MNRISAPGIRRQFPRNFLCAFQRNRISAQPGNRVADRILHIPRMVSQFCSGFVMRKMAVAGNCIQRVPGIQRTRMRNFTNPFKERNKGARNADWQTELFPSAYASADTFQQFAHREITVGKNVAVSFDTVSGSFKTSFCCIADIRKIKSSGLLRKDETEKMMFYFAGGAASGIARIFSGFPLHKASIFRKILSGSQSHHLSCSKYPVRASSKRLRIILHGFPPAMQ